MTIIKYDTKMQDELLKMFINCFNNDMKCKWSEHFIEDKILDLFISKWSDDILSIDVVEESGRLIGFAIYQIDTHQSDWCKKNGWGFIRELYIQKEYRKLGYGFRLVKSIEHALYSKNVKDIYLNADDAILFWEKCNYIDTNEIDSDGMHTLIKTKPSS